MLKNGYVTIRQGFEDIKPYILKGSNKYYLKNYLIKIIIHLKLSQI